MRRKETKTGCLAGSRHKSSAGAAWRGEHITVKPSHIQQCPFGKDLELSASLIELADRGGVLELERKSAVFKEKLSLWEGQKGQTCSWFSEA